MAWGLEARVPFLDHEVVELAARIPAELKVRGGGKYILKEAARSVVPAEVIDRPKGYFPVPALKYLRHSWSLFAMCWAMIAHGNAVSSTDHTWTSFLRTLKGF
jgi:asparagine synthetase B (glutamine-hydrolysing)